VHVTVLCVVTEQQKYISGIYRNIGFAFLSPTGVLILQYLVFEKNFSVIRFTLCILISTLSWIFFYMGYNEINEKINDR